LLSFQ